MLMSPRKVKGICNKKMKYEWILVTVFLTNANIQGVTWIPTKSKVEFSVTLVNGLNW